MIDQVAELFIRTLPLYLWMCNPNEFQIKFQITFQHLAYLFWMNEIFQIGIWFISFNVSTIKRLLEKSYNCQ